MRREKVIIAMSGGVDSSVAAALLCEQGYEVIGLTLRVWPKEHCADAGTKRCCSSSDIDDARLVADALGIPLYVLDREALFRQEVIDYAVNAYREGKTPNPCVVCNERVKFAVLADMARQLDARYYASGHYAHSMFQEDAGRYVVRQGQDRAKDQSYFLFSLSQECLSHMLLPLGTYTKRYVRQKARDLGLPVADKADSQEICFRKEGSLQSFLHDELTGSFSPGDIVDVSGKRLGEHPGVCFFTVGQRRGLGVAAGKPLYVVAIDVAQNRLVVGTKEDVSRRSFYCAGVNWVGCEPLTREYRATVKIRYGHPNVDCVVKPMDDGRLAIDMDMPQEAVTPGQAAVIYEDDVLLAGGWISLD